MGFGIGIGITVALVTIAVRVAAQPASFRIERSATFAASPQSAFSFVNDFHRWPLWSPWAKMDPAMVTTYEGPPAGVGSVYEWRGNNKVGAGKMTIRESEPDRRIGLELQFFRPMAATNVGEFKFERVPEGVRVTWSMSGSNNFVAKAFSLFMDIDKMVGKDFDNGLLALKKLAEAGPAALPA
ncbi:MAG: polyketide cyclase [Myxococcaceae bacterium]|nr:polyketide cyclase [Myxococcaceae bacterium]